MYIVIRLTERREADGRLGQTIRQVKEYNVSILARAATFSSSFYPIITRYPGLGGRPSIRRTIGRSGQEWEKERESVRLPTERKTSRRRRRLFAASSTHADG